MAGEGRVARDGAREETRMTSWVVDQGPEHKTGWVDSALNNCMHAGSPAP